MAAHNPLVSLFKRRNSMKHLSLLALALVLAASAAFAGAYPERNVSVIVPYGAGGTTDLATRAMLDSVKPGEIPSGVSFIVVNMPGGSGLVGVNKFSTSAKDGYTIGTVNCDFLLNVVRGATPLSLANFIPLVFVQADPYLVLVRSDAPYKTFQQLLDHIKANPGEVIFGDSGPGAVPHLAVTAIEKSFGVSVQTISYDNSLESSLAVVNGESHVTISHPSAASGQLKAGALIPLAVTSNQRLANFPDVPAIGEIYKEAADMRILSWISIAALDGTPPEIVSYLQRIFSESVRSKAFNDKLTTFQSQPISILTADDMAKFFAEQTEYYKKQQGLGTGPAAASPGPPPVPAREGCPHVPLQYRHSGGFRRLVHLRDDRRLQPATGRHGKIRARLLALFPGYRPAPAFRRAAAGNHRTALFGKETRRRGRRAAGAGEAHFRFRLSRPDLHL
jgi:tripartite-type tricarboxylate transporter receptor subunit TctC